MILNNFHKNQERNKLQFTVVKQKKLIQSYETLNELHTYMRSRLQLSFM